MWRSVSFIDRNSGVGPRKQNHLWSLLKYSEFKITGSVSRVAYEERTSYFRNLVLVKYLLPMHISWTTVVIDEMLDILVF